jgi:hypothetical protein
MKKSSLIVSVVAWLAPTLAFANYFCAGPVDAVGVDPNGQVWFASATAGFSYVVPYSVTSTYGAISTSTCQAMLAVLIRAQATGATVQWAFNDSLTCASVARMLKTSDRVLRRTHIDP